MGVPAQNLAHKEGAAHTCWRLQPTNFQEEPSVLCHTKENVVLLSRAQLDAAPLVLPSLVPLCSTSL